jgi:hypothetical protein
MDRTLYYYFLLIAKNFSFSARRSFLGLKDFLFFIPFAIGHPIQFPYIS